MANERNESIKKLRELLEDIDFCMMTTMDGGQLRCRPMSTQAAEFDGEVWFFTRDDSHKMSEIEKENRVCLGYANPDDSTYVSVSGRAELSKDRAKMEELWNPILKAWFPDGLEDPNICLMKVTVEQAEYWESPSGKVVQLLGCKGISNGSGSRLWRESENKPDTLAGGTRVQTERGERVVLDFHLNFVNCLSTNGGDRLRQGLV